MLKFKNIENKKNITYELVYNEGKLTSKDKKILTLAKKIEEDKNAVKEFKKFSNIQEILMVKIVRKYEGQKERLALLQHALLYSHKATLEYVIKEAEQYKLFEKIAGKEIISERLDNHGDPISSTVVYEDGAVKRKTLKPGGKTAANNGTITDEDENGKKVLNLNTTSQVTSTVNILTETESCENSKEAKNSSPDAEYSDALSVDIDESSNEDSGIYIPPEENLREELIRSFKEHEAIINAKDEDGYTDLHCAVQNNDKESVKLLIRSGADFNVRDKDGWTALHFAIVLSDVEMVKYLVESGADFNVQDRDGWTALNYAAIFGKAEMKEYLKKIETSTCDQNANMNKQEIHQSEQCEVVPSTSFCLYNLDNVTKAQNDTLNRMGSSIQNLSSLGQEESENVRNQLEKLQKELNEKTQALESIETQLTEKEGKVSELDDQVTKFTEENIQLKSELESTRKTLGVKDSTVTQLTEENTELKNELKLKKPKNENNDLKTKLQQSESKSKGLESRVKNLQKQLEDKNGLESQIQGLQKQLESRNEELNGKNKKFSAASAQSKRQGNYASVSFLLSGAFAVGAILTIFHLAICITLAVAALTFLAVGCYCSYKANTALSNVEVKNGVDSAAMKVLNSPS